MRLKPEIEEAIDNEEADELGIGSSDGFWYDLTQGGYFKPEQVLADQKDIDRVNEALKVLEDLEEIYNRVVPEF